MFTIPDDGLHILSFFDNTEIHDSGQRWAEIGLSVCLKARLAPIARGHAQSTYYD
jgi:hypothetical protein